MNAQVSQTSFGSSLLYEDRLPVKIECYGAEPERGELLRLGLLNDEVLRSVMSLDEIVATDKNDDGDRHNELQRLETKVNLVLDMLGELYAQSVSLPQAIPVKLGTPHVYWLTGLGERVPDPGSYVALHIYLTRRFPRPLVLLGRVMQATACEAGESWVELHLLAMPQQTQDSLERFLFRQHRRLVAFSRRK